MRLYSFVFNQYVLCGSVISVQCLELIVVYVFRFSDVLDTLGICVTSNSFEFSIRRAIMAGSKLDIGPQALGACARCGTVAMRDTLVSWLVQLTVNCLEVY